MYTIGFIGIDNAGKTTIIDLFTQQKLVRTIPTVGVNLEQIAFSEIDFDLHVLDMGGQKNFRLLWVDYLNTVDVILYVIDSSDHERLDETLNELRKMLVLTEANAVPILMLLNKIDLPDTISGKEISEKLSEFSELANRDWDIIETSAVTTKGLVEMFKWIYTKTTSTTLELEVDFTEAADKKYYIPCPLLLKLADGDYCINHDEFVPIKVVPLDTIFSDNLIDKEQVIRDTVEEFEKMGNIVCFNSIFVSENDELIHCATDTSQVEVEGITADKEEYIDSYNMMHLTGGVICSECLYKILFSALKRRIKAGIKVKVQDIENIKNVETQKAKDLSRC
ncbi:MAG: ADP-ribosylation factor family protein [Candidatus Thorarchaeota archaeon]